MSVLCCHITNFLFNLAAQRQPAWREQPVALLGEDERVWALSPIARQSGIQAGLTPRQARMRCPDVRLHSLDWTASEDAQAAFAGTLVQTGLNAEVQGYGLAYLDLSPVTRSPSDALPVCAELGKQVRMLLGVELQPALGCDTGKFTARAAALVAPQGRMRAVDQADEVRFLAPLPVTLLPLPLESLQLLHWLGLTTLNDFARLSISDVTQRFGKPGKLAHTWARGQDRRPVRPTAKATPETIDVHLDAPTASHDVVVSEAMQALRPSLRAMHEQLEGCRRLRVELIFLDRSTLSVTHSFVTPLSDASAVRLGLSRALRTHAWRGELTSLSIMLLEVAELHPQQLTLFDLGDLDRSNDVSLTSPFARLVETLSVRHGGAFFTACVKDATHPIRERRTELSALASA